ncbi:hypothetical protein EVAR_56217_1 [Eumeta japonica]|uniref:Uncharacterized protein n=1 Tax=Eumeta variegata TaxID=151549 RepID=A0A4C1YY00_EUMVA|nr:hypothetical protein EVAR_56217_1 [Eumeta japonica]
MDKVEADLEKVEQDQHISSYDSLLKCNETEPFLKRSITGDEKWFTYDKNVRKRSWSKGKQDPQTIAKLGLTCNKLMLCMVGLERIIHLEILPPSKLSIRISTAND